MDISCSKHTIRYALVLSSLLLPSCSGIDLNAESNLNTNRAQIQYQDEAVQVRSSDLSEGFYKKLARDYRRYGDDGLHLSFLYNPHSSSKGAYWAATQAAQASEALRAEGVSAVKADILPVKDADKHDPDVLITYTQVIAHAPEGCDEDMPGLNNMNMELNYDYKLGCGLEAMIAKQVFRPQDLQGRGGQSPISSGRRAANMSDANQAGVPNEPLEGGESASEISE